MNIAPFSLIERDQLGQIRRVVPLEFIQRRNLITINEVRRLKLNARRGGKA